jgi:hypothetical protein
MNFNNINWFKLAQNSTQDAIRLLGDKSKLKEVKQLLNRTNKPFKHYSYVSYLISKNTPINSINQVINEVEKLFNENKLQNILANQSGITVVDSKNNKYNADNLIKFQETIHSIESSYQKLVGTNTDSLEELKDKIVYEGNNITVYKADGPGDCITLGEGQSFCISRRDTQNAYYTYRNSYKSTFYFVYDKNFKETEPLSLVVVDVQKNTIELTDKNNKTGTIDKYNTNSYLDYLKSKGVPVDSLVNKPMTEEEVLENKKLGTAIQDLEWFKELTREEKYKYISRFHELTKEQFKEIINDKELINKYLSTGNPLDNESVKSLNNSQLSIYKHAREKIVSNANNANSASNIVLSDILLFGENIVNNYNITFILEDEVRANNLENYIYIINKYKDIISYENIRDSLEEDASYYKSYNIIKYIIDNYRNIEDVIDTDSINSTLLSVLNGNNVELSKYIIDNFKDKINNETINMSLKECAGDNSIDSVKYILDNHLDKLNYDSINYALESAFDQNDINTALIFHR